MSQPNIRFADLSSIQAREVIKSAVAVGVFQGGLLLGLLPGLLYILLQLLSH